MDGVFGDGGYSLLTGGQASVKEIEAIAVAAVSVAAVAVCSSWRMRAFGSSSYFCTPLSLLAAALLLFMGVPDDYFCNRVRGSAS